jgi:cell division protein FtsB
MTKEELLEQALADTRRERDELRAERDALRSKIGTPLDFVNKMVPLFTDMLDKFARSES